MEKITVITVCGPTACGKTALGVELALRFGGEVISADSMQVYRRLDIGTAKPTPDEMCGVRHHMIDVAEPWERYSVARYCAEASVAVNDIASRGVLPILVGGTGLYIDNLLFNTDFSAPEGDAALRAELAAAAEEKGNEYVHGLLRRLDESEADRIHPNNLKRVIRAIELASLTGEKREEINRKSRRPSPYRTVRLMPDFPRDELYSRINRRVDIMLEHGLADEVRRELLPLGNRAPTASQAIGYKEMLEYLGGGVSLAEATEKIKQNSRRYAKRQLTWFRKSEELHLISPENAITEAAEICARFLEGRVAEQADNF